jgi:hypothetical protein
MVLMLGQLRKLHRYTLPHLFHEFLCLIQILHETYCRFRNASGLSVHVRNVHDMQRNMRALFHMVKVKKHIQVGWISGDSPFY